MKYKAVMVMLGVCPTYEGETVDEALEKAANDNWIKKDIHESWAFADPIDDWEEYDFSNFMVVDEDSKTVVMCVWNPEFINAL